MPTTWHYTTKAIVSAFSQIPEADLSDSYIEWVEKLIDNFTDTTYTGTTTYTETYSGDDTGILPLKHKPIVSVSDLSVDDADFTSSDYKVYDEHIELVSTTQTEVSNALYRASVFPVGEKNISVTYIAGSAIVPKNVELAATQMVALIAMINKREGSDASLKYSKTTRNDGDSNTVTETYGLQSGLNSIMKAYLQKRWKFR